MILSGVYLIASYSFIQDNFILQETKTLFIVKRIVLLTVLLFAGIIANGQVPEGFNYQGIARNSTGQIISGVTLGVRIEIIDGIVSPLVIWAEEHVVETNDFGLFTLMVGDPDATIVPAEAASFDKIDWSRQELYIRTSIKEEAGTWQVMEPSKILSVPYALNASSVGSLESLEVMEAQDNPVEEALFEVRNKNGQTIFAVYNEGVRVYVDDNQAKSKGPKGGFAIGGFDDTKGLTYEFFRVTPDSIRLYVDEGATKGPKGGFAIGGFSRTKGLTEDLMHLTEDNYFIGYGSGNNISTGLYNSFFGYMAGVMNSSGDNNVFIGNETGYNNEGGNWNIFVGNNSGYLNSSGNGNIILGDEAGYNNSDGSWNVFLGDLSGWSNTSGESNVYIGSDAGLSSTIGNYNVFMGSTSGFSNTEGSSNVFIGESSGYTNTTGEGNVFMGTESGHENTIGDYNVFIGEMSGWSNSDGEDNVFIGASAGEYNTTGAYNVFMGTTTGQNNLTGIGNVFIGQESGFLNDDGNLNVAIGPQAGYSNVSGENNVFLGFQSGAYETGSNRLYIDNAGSTWDKALVYGEFDWGYLSFYADVEAAGDVTSTGFNVASDRALKKNITDLPATLGKVMQLRPVEFDWLPGSGVKGAETAGRQTGLIAQEVEQVFPDAISLNKKGNKTINYTHITVSMLKAIQDQQQIIEQLQQENSALREYIESIDQKVETLIGKGGLKE